jgi:hypothetical protein
MTRRIRSALSYSNVVSTLCLFVLLGGSAYAASSGLIDGKKLEPRSIPAKAVKKNALTGAEINERKLGRVPDAARLNGKPASAYLTAGSVVQSAANAVTATTATNALEATNAASATNATHAADAAKLGGKDPSAYLTSDRVVAGSGATDAVPAKTLFTYAPLALTVQTDGTADNAYSVVLVNNGPDYLDVSTSTAAPPQLPVNPDGGTLKLTVNASNADLGTFVIRRFDAPLVAVTITCGFDQQPNVVNCSGVGIG